jgi:hydroxymethylpyrimidine kinase/phosphomethylpyrimidine kinase
MEKTENRNPKPKICLTIAGLDPSGGAGIIADVKTFSAFGCFAAAAVASLTFQNTRGVYGAEAQTAETVRRQVVPVLEDFEVAAVKTGMLPTREVIEEVAALVSARKLENFVVDPVVRSTSGFDLIDEPALEALIEKLFPLSDLITPNIPEAERITRTRIENAADIRRAARLMQSYGAKNVLIKGGHLPLSDFNPDLFSPSDQSKIEDQSSKIVNRPAQSIDFLFLAENESTFAADYIETTATHGTGCTFAAAIAANLALGKPLAEAVETAKRFVTEAIRTAPGLGGGHSPINQLLRVEN